MSLDGNDKEGRVKASQYVDVVSCMNVASCVTNLCTLKQFKITLVNVQFNVTAYVPS